MATQLLKGAPFNFPNCPDGEAQKSGYVFLSQKTGGGFPTPPPDTNGRLSGECAGCGTLSPRFGLPFQRQSQGGGSISQARALPDLFAGLRA